MKNHAFISALILCVITPQSAWALASKTSAVNTGSQSNSTKKKGEISFTGVYGELLTNVEHHVRLVKRLRDKKAAPLLDGERRRLESRVSFEIKQALEPFGYYNATVRESKINTQNNKGEFKYQYSITLNQAVKVAAVELRFNEEAMQQAEFTHWQARFPLEQGMLLNQARYDSAKKQLMANAIRLGYFDAQYTQSTIVINEARTSAKISLHFNSGKRYSISDVSINWNIAGVNDEKNKRGIDPDILSSLFSVEKDQFYLADNLAKTQRSLLATPYFSSVDVRSDDRDQHNHTVPVTVNLTPSKRKAYNLAIGAGTDTGIRTSVGYENRRINRKGHHIHGRIGGSSIQKTAAINYRIPLARSAKDSLNFFASLNEETGDTRRFQTAKIGSEWTRKWDKSIIKFGVTASREKFERVDDNAVSIEREVDLLMPTFSWDRTKSDDLHFPLKGWSANLLLRGANESLGSDIDLVQAIFNGKVLRPLGAGRLKLRVTLAGSLIDQFAALPESLGFLAGGDESIRGYSYESIGVEKETLISVGKHLVVGSLEYEHPIKNGFALAGFVDMGDAFDNRIDYKRGAGIGLRWRLPFGALRLDAASALDLDGQPFRLHFSFGTDL